nr:hypothetical protein Iba_chr14aCG6520 [Ipomoea batatas]
MISPKKIAARLNHVPVVPELTAGRFHLSPFFRRSGVRVELPYLPPHVVVAAIQLLRFSARSPLRLCCDSAKCEPEVKDLPPTTPTSCAAVRPTPTSTSESHRRATTTVTSAALRPRDGDHDQPSRPAAPPPRIACFAPPRPRPAE